MFIINRYYIHLKKFFTPTPNVIGWGRWTLKDEAKIEYYMTNLHADPGYPNSYK